MKNKLNPKINKKSFKAHSYCCKICGEKNQELLDVHRLKPGKEDGEYTQLNSCCLCANCHRKAHANIITIDKYYLTSSGYKLRVIIDGKEDFI